MPVARWENLIQIEHTGEGTEAAARRLAADARVKLAGAPAGPLAVFHDATHLETASQEYATVFAAFMREFPAGRVLQVAVIPKAWMRVLAKTASVLGGVPIHIYKTTDEARRYLAEQGFAAPDVTAA